MRGSPPSFLRASVFLGVLTACSAPPTVAPATNPMPAPVTPEVAAPAPDASAEAAEAPPNLSAEDAARRFYEAMVAADVEGMRAVAITHEEMAALSNNAPPPTEYEELLEAFLQDRARELREAPPGTKLADVVVKNRQTLRAAESEKLKKDVEIARVAPVLEVNGERREGMPLLFLRTGQGFRMSIRD